MARDELNQTFTKLIRQVGLEGRGARARPRPHDLRHAFAVRTLLDWYPAGEDVDRRMPLLSTYLGHVDPASTYWYLRGGPRVARSDQRSAGAAARGARHDRARAGAAGVLHRPADHPAQLQPAHDRRLPRHVHGCCSRFAHDQTGKQPFQLDIDDLDAPLIGAFLTHLEHDRGNSPRTRNARLGAIHSFYRFAALEHPEHAHTIARVMAIPTKRHERNTVCYLDLTEITALLAAPDRDTWLGRRDHALLVLMIQTGVRVSELVGLRVGDVHLGIGPHIQVTGQGTQETRDPADRAKPSRSCCADGSPNAAANPTTRCSPPARAGRSAATPSALLVTKHATTAAATCPSLTAKRVTPHVLRHTNAMLLRANRRRHRHDRAVARSREHPDHPHLRARRPRAQGTKQSPGPRRSAAKPGRYRPSDDTPGLPRSPLIMWNI